MFTCYEEYDHGQESLGNNVYHVHADSSGSVKVHECKVLAFM